MWKLQKIRDGELLRLALSGRIEREHLAELQEILESEVKTEAVVLDLDAVKLVDQDVVMFLASCEISGIRLENCPGYIREWISRGRFEGDGRPPSEKLWN